MVSRNAPNSTIEATPRELDSRTTSDGIHVRLVWQPRDERVTVVVEDTKVGEAFELTVGPGQRALDVFRHPYAYAAEPATPSVSRRPLTQSRSGELTTRPRKRLQ